VNMQRVANDCFVSHSVSVCMCVHVRTRAALNDFVSHGVRACVHVHSVCACL